MLSEVLAWQLFHPPAFLPKARKLSIELPHQPRYPSNPRLEQDEFQARVFLEDALADKTAYVVLHALHVDAVLFESSCLNARGTHLRSRHQTFTCDVDSYR